MFFDSVKPPALFPYPLFVSLVYIFVCFNIFKKYCLLFSNIIIKCWYLQFLIYTMILISKNLLEDLQLNFALFGFQVIPFWKDRIENFKYHSARLFVQETI